MIFIIVLSVWAPWINSTFAHKQVIRHIGTICEEYHPVFKDQHLLGAPIPSYTKLVFGSSYSLFINCPPTLEAPKRNKYFVSFLGTVHEIESYNIN